MPSNPVYEGDHSTGTQAGLYASSFLTDTYTTTDENGSVILGSGSAYCGRPLQGTLTSSRNYFAASVGIGTYRYSFSYWDGTPYPFFPICDTAGPDPSVNVIYSSCCCGPVVSPVPASCPRSWGYRGTSARYSFLRSFDSTASVQISRLSLSAAPRYCLAGTYYPDARMETITTTHYRTNLAARIRKS